MLTQTWPGRAHAAWRCAAFLGFTALLSLTGCAHAPAPVAAAPAVSAPAAPIAPVPPTVAATSPAPATVEAADPPVPGACQLSANDIGQLHQLAKIRHYLRQSAFPNWENSWPHLFLYGERCQFILNYAENPGDGFRLSTQKFNLGSFGSDLVFYRENSVSLPTGVQLHYSLPAQALTYGERGGEKWFVMGWYEVWRRDYGDSLQSFFGMLAREMFRSYQQRIPGMRPLGDAALREAFAHFCRQNPEFAQMVDVERSLLMRAILENDPAKKRDWVKQYLDNETKRRSRFFVGEHAGWRKEEPWLEAVDGSAEYMNFRILADCPDIPKDARLTDAAGKSFGACTKPALNEALRRVAFRPIYLQDLGVLQVILLQQVVPHWQDSIFREQNSVEALLTTYVEPHVTR